MIVPLRFAIGASCARFGRRTLQGRRQHARGRKVTDFPQESLELHRCEAKECLRRVGAGADKRVRHALQPVVDGRRLRALRRTARRFPGVPFERILFLGVRATSRSMIKTFRV
jgi:hypothetical protein